ncbi:MAG: helix-turn-helix transcriptional regulator [Burkholderiales bacterium]|nr:helix-turn-helix transcriptional regulator [Burkholderiales bacterium]
MSKKKKPEGSRAIVASNLRNFRKKLNLSQEGLAEISGLHRTYVSSVERCERNVTIDTIDRLSTALGIEPFQLLKEIEE